MPYFTAGRFYLFVAMLAGAAGVGLQALGTHLGSADATIAGQFLLFHAPAMMGVVILRRVEYLRARPASLLLGLMMIGLVLFSGDLAMRGLLQRPMFRMAAPAGGGVLIVSWLLLSLLTLVPRRT